MSEENTEFRYESIPGVELPEPASIQFTPRELGFLHTLLTAHVYRGNEDPDGQKRALGVQSKIYETLRNWWDQVENLQRIRGMWAAAHEFTEKMKGAQPEAKP